MTKNIDEIAEIADKEDLDALMVHLPPFLERQQLELAARNLQHLIKIKDEQLHLDNVVASIQQSMIDAHGNNPSDLCDMMVVQARIMDSLFHYYLDKSKATPYTEDDKIGAAMKAQAQSLRTVHAWKKLKEENYIKHKIIRYALPEEKTTRNEVDKNAEMDT